MANWVVARDTGKVAPIQFDPNGRAYRLDMNDETHFTREDLPELMAVADCIWEVDNLATMENPTILWNAPFG